MSEDKFDITTNFAVISPDKKVTTEACDATLYERIERNYEGFKSHELVSCHEFEEDWASWEMHPHGDEIVMLLSGQATMILETDAGEKTIFVDKEDAYIVVPKGIWHTMRTTTKTKMLFITPGEATEHREA
ncbi:MAG: cupin domain-containing protein [Cellvibrionaceae bacterium]